MTAHHALDKQAQRDLLTVLRDTSWSWKEADVPVVATRLGWKIDSLTPTFSATVDPGHGLGPKAYRFSFLDGRVTDVTLRITSKIDDGDVAGRLFLSDVFADAVTAGTEILGDPVSRTIGELPEVRWRGEEATIIVQDLSIAVTVFWRYNERQDEMDRIAEDFEG